MLKSNWIFWPVMVNWSHKTYGPVWPAVACARLVGATMWAPTKRVPWRLLYPTRLTRLSDLERAFLEDVKLTGAEALRIDDSASLPY